MSSFTGTKGPSTTPEKQPSTMIPPPSTNLIWCDTVWQVPFSWQPANSSIGLSDRQAWFTSPENTSPLLWSPVATRCTPLYPTLCIALDARLGCSCSEMETHSIKLSTCCSWANPKATWRLEGFSYRLCRTLRTSAHCAPQHSLTSLCDFCFLWLSCCCSQLLPLC